MNPHTDSRSCQMVLANTVVCILTEIFCFFLYQNVLHEVSKNTIYTVDKQ